MEEIDPRERAKRLSHEGLTYIKIADRFNQIGVRWKEQPFEWTKGSVTRLIESGDPIAPDTAAPAERDTSNHASGSYAGMGGASGKRRRQWAPLLAVLLPVIVVMAVVVGATWSGEQTDRGGSERRVEATDRSSASEDSSDADEDLSPEERGAFCVYTLVDDGASPSGALDSCMQTAFEAYGYDNPDAQRAGKGAIAMSTCISQSSASSCLSELT